MFAQTIAGYLPVGAATFVTSLVAGSAGLATPLAILLAGLGCVVTAAVIAQFAQRLPHAGAIYEYASHACGMRIGAAAGWTDFCALALLALAMLFGIGHWTSQFLREYGHVQVHWYLITLAASIPVAVLTILDVRISARTQMTCVAFSLAVVGTLLGWILLKGGSAGHSWAPFQVATAPGGWRGIGYGLIFAMGLLAGFEAPATLSEETVNPRRTIPLVMIAAPAVLTIYLVLVTYTYAIGYGAGGAAELGKDSTALLTMAARYAGVWLVRRFSSPRSSTRSPACSQWSAFPPASALHWRAMGCCRAVGWDGPTPASRPRISPLACSCCPAWRSASPSCGWRAAAISPSATFSARGPCCSSSSTSSSRRERSATSNQGRAAPGGNAP